MSLLKSEKHSRFNIFLISVFILSAISVATSFYFEQKLGLQPCPMCIGQRVCMIVIVVLSFLALIFLLSRRLKFLVIILGFLLLIIISLGLYMAVRQVYLQSLPPGEAPVCGPGLNYLVKVLPWQKVAMTILHGTGECAEVSWRFLSLSIAGWSAVVFGVLWILNLLGIIRAFRNG